MAGLIQEAQQGMSSEQIAQVKKGYQMASQILYEKEIFASMMEEFQQMEPTEAVAHAVVSILTTVKQQLGAMDLMSALALGMAILGEVVDAVRQVGIDLPGEQVEQALGLSVQMYLAASAGEFDPEELRMLAQQGQPTGEQGMSQQELMGPQGGY